MKTKLILFSLLVFLGLCAKGQDGPAHQRQTPYTANFGRLYFDQFAQQFKCNDDPFSLCQIKWVSDHAAHALDAVDVGIEPVDSHHVVVSLHIGVLEMPIGQNFANGIFRLPNDVKLDGAQFEKINKDGRITTESEPTRMLLAGDYAYHVDKKYLHIESVVCTIFVQFTTPTIECARSGNYSGSRIRFSCNMAPDSGTCVRISGPNAPNYDIPWTGNDFISPMFASTNGATYGLEIVYCGGGRAYSYAAGYPFPNNNPILVAPNCRTVHYPNVPITYESQINYDKTLASTDNTNLIPTIKIFPNPATNQITVQWADEASEITSIRIFDMVGRCYSQEMQANDGWSATLDIAHLQPGNYVLLARFKNSNLERKFQFIKL